MKKVIGIVGEGPTDLLVIQMDANVSRKEKEVHCLCESNRCNDKGKMHPLKCDEIKNKNGPVILPCEAHVPSPAWHIS